MNVAVYCSARNGLDDNCVDLARQLGQWLGRNGHTLVYGGVEAGLMHEVAAGTVKAGGRVVGVVPRLFAHRADPLANETITVRDLGERKQRMIELAHAFVVLPGGIGTLDEWMTTLDTLLLTDEQKPIVVANLNHLYDDTVRQLAALQASPLARDKHLDVSILVNDATQLISTLDQISQHHSNNEK